MSLYNTLLGAGSYLTINKTLLKQLGLEPAFLFSILIDFENYLLDSKQIEQSGDWFYAGREKLQEQTTLSEYKQKEAEKILVKLGLIELKLKGTPAKNHYRICSEQVLKIFENLTSNNLGTRDEKTSEHYINNTKENNTKENNTKEHQPSELLEDSIFKETWKDFKEHRKKLKKPMTARAEKDNLKDVEKYSNMDVEKATQLVEYAIKRGWHGIYPIPKEEKLPDKNNDFSEIVVTSV
jgi:hypothetical protein